MDAGEDIVLVDLPGDRLPDGSAAFARPCRPVTTCGSPSSTDASSTPARRPSSCRPPGRRRGCGTGRCSPTPGPSRTSASSSPATPRAPTPAPQMGGHSQVVSATGEALAMAGTSEEVLSVEVDMDAVTTWRESSPCCRTGGCDGCVHPGRHSPPRARAGRSRLAQHRGRVALAGRPAWSDRGAGLLDLLLRQLPARPRRAASPRGGVSPTRLVLIGVHSPKFEHEADADALAAAVERYAVHHPVLDDPELVTWQAYTARAWPTLVVIDPEGYIVASMSGEGHAHGLSVLVEELIAEHSAKGTLRQGDSPYAAPAPAETALRFPGKAAALADGSFLVSDTAHHEIVWLETDLETERRRFPTSAPNGETGLMSARAERAAGRARAPGRDGSSASATTSSSPTRSTTRSRGCGWPTARGRSWPAPAGSCANGPAAARPSSRTSRPRGTWPGSSTGSSSRWRAPTSCGRCTWPPTRPTTRSPCSAGPPRRASATVQPTRRGSRSRPASPCPQDGTRLWVADSETSALRSLDVTDEGFVVTTHVGQGLFDFGHRDGPADQALLQHPLGVTVLPDGSVAVSDTYNGAIRRFDPDDPRGEHPRDRPARALRRGRGGRGRCGRPGRRCAAGRRGVRRPPARADRVARQGPTRRRPRPPDPAAPHRGRRRARSP